MDIARAVSLVNDAAQPPGWTLTAEDATRRHHGAIRLNVSIAARDSNRGHAPRYRATVPGGARAAFFILVDDITADDTAELFARVVDRLAEAFVHEVREFLRIWDGHRWFAPLHPHHASGMAAWATHNHTSADADLMFGAA